MLAMPLTMCNLVNTANTPSMYSDSVRGWEQGYLEQALIPGSTSAEMKCGNETNKTMSYTVCPLTNGLVAPEQ